MTGYCPSTVHFCPTTPGGFLGNLTAATNSPCTEMKPGVDIMRPTARADAGAAKLQGSTPASGRSNIPSETMRSSTFLALANEFEGLPLRPRPFETAAVASAASGLTFRCHAANAALFVRAPSDPAISCCKISGEFQANQLLLT